MDTKQFTWNPTVYSYVLHQIQETRKAGGKTSVRRVQERKIVTATEIGWQVRIDASPEGFAFVKAAIAACIADPNMSVTTASAHI